MSTPAGKKRDKSKDLSFVGQTIAGKYRVLEVLGQGGFGSVFLVEIVAGMVGERLALKLIPRELSSDEKIKGQFLNEIRVAMRMVNKYIVQIRDVGETADGQLYYTMDYCPGENLAAILKREVRLPPARAIPIVLRVLEALKTAHAAGVIHRDLKPANIMVFQQESYETARVLDFGIATVIEGGKRGGSGFVGSPHYMPPEQFLNEELGFYTDTYAVGVILYECLTGEKPYRGRTAQEVYNDLKSRPVTPPEQVNPELAAYPGLSALIYRALERNPELRFQAAKDLFSELKAVLEGKAEPALPAAAAAAPAAGVRRRPVAAAHAARRGSSLGPSLAVALGTGGLGVAAVVVLLVLNQPPPSAPTPPPDPAPVVVRQVQATPAPPAPQDEDVLLPVEINIVEPPTAAPAAKTSGSSQSSLPAGGPSGTPAKAQPRPVDAAIAKREAQETARKRVAGALELARGEKWDKVREACADALLLDPTSLEAYRLKGQAELKMGLIGDAVTSLENWRAGTPAEKQEANPLLLLAEACKARPGSSPEALRQILFDAQTAVEREPQNREGLLKLLGYLEELQAERAVMALVEMARARNVEDGLVTRLHQKYFVDLPRERETQAQAHLQGARKALQDGDFTKAAAEAQQGFRLAPLPELGLTLALAHLESGNTRESMSALEAVGPRLKEDAERVARLGLLYARNYLSQYETGTKKKPDLLEMAFENLGAVLQAVQDSKTKQDELIAAARTYRARCHAHQVNLTKVDEDIKAAKAARDRDLDLIYYQAETYYILGDLARDPDRSAAFQRGVQRLTWFKEFPEARKESRGYFLMGRCYLKLGGKRENFNDAIKQFSEAERFGMKNDPRLCEARAEAYIGLGDQIRAGQQYRASFEITPTEDACVKAATCFLEANNRISAEDMLKRGLARFPQSVQIKSLLPRVAR